MLSACTGTVAATTCVESNVPGGQWKYSVTPVFGTTWQGTESAMSSTVLVGPLAVADSYTVNEDAVLTVSAAGVLANDTGSTLTAILVSGVANGTLALSSNGAVSYTPNSNFNGSDSFTYKANNGTLDSSTVTVSITVSAVNDAPVNAVPVTQETPKNTAKTFTSGNNNLVSISDLDAGGATVQVQLVGTNGTMNLPVTTGLTFAAGANNSATMTFTGTIANINLRLAGMVFTPTNNFT